jgi:hypothetical protein
MTARSFGRSLQSCCSRRRRWQTELVEVVKACQPHTATQLKWLKTRMKQAAPQALVVAS